MKYRPLFLSISTIVIIVGILSILKWGLKIGIDFKGGTLIEYRLQNGEKKVERYGQLGDVQIEKIRSDYKAQGATEERLETVGPTIGPELVKKTIYGLAISTSLILLWIAYQFKSIKFGISATVATLHDAIVVIGMRGYSKNKTLANMALSETMVRSINNSFTIIFMLAALILLGGETTKWFASALLIGTISGTYSSPFVAVPILVTWDEIQKKLKNRA
ncbi:MAG: Protein translocase subunit SecF [Candidatus Woesebacteria bacterium GW2011_GWA2_40_7]|uniref:Protein translocase subunit SecF n=1 Tax=Candidatus Woesebacteria bacterium GW2011_GWA2_40_7 TaxID=1618562 RepID=A0A0G0VJ53_9BACT|nr:MAG: Protein translocase subunit SecF [Candidatus Woesebacteria bacterium GW2011_GWA2_40_7]